MTDKKPRFDDLMREAEAVALAGDTRPETFPIRLQRVLELHPPVDPTRLVEYNGVFYKIEALPSAELRALAGYGHADPFSRPLLERPDGKNWLYTPNMCLVADTPRGVWVDDRHLACPGCGVDFT